MEIEGVSLCLQEPAHELVWRITSPVQSKPDTVNTILSVMSFLVLDDQVQGAGNS
jgi:hypothetical protein